MSSNFASAAVVYSTGFEDFSLGAIDPSAGAIQGGWSGGALPDFVNNNVGDEQIVNTIAKTGNQSWHYARGYGSPGAGTPFTPNLSSALVNVGDTFSGSLSFRAHTAGDGSSLAIETGNLAGNDRAEILAYITNASGNLSVSTFNWLDGASTYSTVDVATGLDASLWHDLTFELTRTLTGNSLSLSVNGGTVVTVAAYLAEWRDSLNFSYSESSRLKFRDRNGDQSDENGFYIDDISYALSSPAAVPEPASIVLLGMAGLGLVGIRRRGNK